MTSAATVLEAAEAVAREREASTDRAGPGFACAVVFGGETRMWTRGLADLGWKAPITVDTPFHIASLSKHITGFAVRLLADRGLIDLDADLSGVFPELENYPYRVTARHCLHHTSGLRDQWCLALASGFGLDDVMTDEHLLRLISLQRGGNAAPGAEHAYCNTGYLLLAELVARRTGRSFASFANAELFAPLAMTGTVIPDRVGQVVPGAARSYREHARGWIESPLTFATTGATGVRTTLADLLLWNAHLAAAAPSGLLESGRLDGGRTTGYGSGLVVDEFRGLRRVHHGGADAAFTSALIRFPDVGLSVMVLANSARIHAPGLAHEVAVACLDVLGVPPAAPAVRESAPVTGRWADPETGLEWDIHGEGDRAMITGAFETLPLVPSETGWRVAGHIDLELLPGRRLRISSLFDAPLTLVPLMAAGTVAPPGGGMFFCDELRVGYQLASEGDDLVLATPRHDVVLRPTLPGCWAGHWPAAGYAPDVGVRLTEEGFTLNFTRARGLAFRRL